MNIQEFNYSLYYGHDSEELSENLAYEIVQQVMELPETEKINFLETEKAKNAIKSELKRRDANQRGSKWRYVAKCMDSWWINRSLKYKERAIPSIDTDDGNNFFSENLFEMESPSQGKNAFENPFLSGGMTVLISKDHKTGAVCFNTNYKGKRIIHE